MEDAYTLTLEDKESHFQELHLNFCGHSVCYPDNSIGPSAHPCYILHYILSGKGEYRVDGRTYSLEQNQGFLIEPNVMSSYKADHDNPWTYLWIGFEGTNAKTMLEALGFSHHKVTFSVNCGTELMKIINAMLESDAEGMEQELFLQSQMFRFFSFLSHELSTDSNIFQRDKQNYYVRAAQRYIYTHYSEDIKIQDIADAAGISRSYLTILFQTILHVSPSDYLTDFRLTRAHEQLQITDLPIGKIAENCGYQNPLVFTRAFKKKIGSTPSAFRSAIREERKIKMDQVRKRK
ncbi:MAG: AraC family transcriptional regulator [Clostridia bacterium]|nr:AraC family transcriptional regulator [Clostridia bacterium]